MAERIEEIKLPLPGTRMTAAEFLALPETLVRIELINGVVVYPFGYPDAENEIQMSPAPTVNHQDVLFNLAKQIDRVTPSGKVRIAPVDLYFDDDNHVQPDIIWTGADSSCVLDAGKRLRGVPDLLIEITSPRTERYDRREKFELYQRFAVAEYWMADPLAQYVEVYRLDGEHYVRQGVYGPGETFVSAAMGQAVDLTGVFD